VKDKTLDRINRVSRKEEKLAAILLLLVVCTACQTSSETLVSRDRATVQFREKLKTVTVSDGISQSEAEIIGRCYFLKHVGCGAFRGVLDGGDRWIVDGAVGPAGVPVQGFFIDKRTGKVTSPIGPSYDNPLDIFP
jgi:hypothetical protein